MKPCQLSDVLLAGNVPCLIDGYVVIRDRPLKVSFEAHDFTPDQIQGLGESRVLVSWARRRGVDGKADRMGDDNR